MVRKGEVHAAAPTKAAPTPAKAAVTAKTAGATKVGAPAKPAAAAVHKSEAGAAPKQAAQAGKGPAAQPQDRGAAVHRAVASAGVSAGVLGGAQALRRNLARREAATIERPECSEPVVDDVVLPALHDAAIAAGTASGTALLVAQASDTAAFQASGSLAGIGRHMGPAVTGFFAAVGVGSALHQWAGGAVSTRDLKKTLTKVVWGIGTGAGVVAAAGASVPCAAALAAGSAAFDLSGATDGVVDHLWGRDRRSIRVDLIRQYAKVLGVAATASDDDMRTKYKGLMELVDPERGFGGTEADLQVLDHCAARLLLLREEARGSVTSPPLTPPGLLTLKSPPGQPLTLRSPPQGPVAGEVFRLDGPDEVSAAVAAALVCVCSAEPAEGPAAATSGWNVVRSVVYSPVSALSWVHGAVSGSTEQSQLGAAVGHDWAVEKPQRAHTGCTPGARSSS
eukprot:TRINITY_DN14396_c0_g1_i3.p1 TRINITY_DN14396_c0_g1~~TRINITY_DN14396_c0_g1_i3.p1  ORF type:complete len:451 (+),score=132.25 TRINITY_DN14396_c0_g1_i3:672-2024(+)